MLLLNKGLVMEKYLTFEILEYVINQKGIQHITGNFEILIMRAKKYEKIYNNLLKDC